MLPLPPDLFWTRTGTATMRASCMTFCTMRAPASSEEPEDDGMTTSTLRSGCQVCCACDTVTAPPSASVATHAHHTGIFGAWRELRLTSVFMNLLLLNE